ncbi:MAG: hypothetical protein KAS07_03545 [Candidatus Pacebacteria bacterium]|nr:hypothetical protein [Candidatus Paceibacterota bacterium]
MRTKRSFVDEQKRKYEKLLETDERFKKLKCNKQKQILNVLTKNKGEHKLTNVELSIVMDARGY